MEEELPENQVQKSGLPMLSLLFVVATIVAVIIGGWIHVSIVRNDLQFQVNELRRM